jgi:Zn finger protein HypA/HybF involved in hydrogenase expression
MHELSVALEMCRIAEAQLSAGQLGRVVGVGVLVGDDAGIEPDNLKFCLDALLAQPPFAGAAATIVRCAGDALRVEYLEVDE